MIACNTSYAGPLNQGLTAGMAYFLSCHDIYAAKIMASNLSDDTVANALSVDPALTFPGSKLLTYLQSALELQLIEYRKDAVKFYEKVELIVIAKAACFGAVFLCAYFVVFLGLLKILKTEIWLTHGMLNMIPIFVLESNSLVQTQIWRRRRTA